MPMSGRTVLIRRSVAVIGAMILTLLGLRHAVRIWPWSAGASTEIVQSGVYMLGAALLFALPYWARAEHRSTGAVNVESRSVRWLKRAVVAGTGLSSAAYAYRLGTARGLGLPVTLIVIAVTVC